MEKEKLMKLPKERLIEIILSLKEIVRLQEWQIKRLEYEIEELRNSFYSCPESSECSEECFDWETWIREEPYK